MRQPLGVAYPRDSSVAVGWSLELGIYLVFGAWCLVFRPSCHDPPRPNPLLRAGAAAVCGVRLGSFHANVDRLVLFASGNRTPRCRRALLPLCPERSQI